MKLRGLHTRLVASRRFRAHLFHCSILTCSAAHRAAWVRFFKSPFARHLLPRQQVATSHARAPAAVLANRISHHVLFLHQKERSLAKTPRAPRTTRVRRVRRTTSSGRFSFFAILASWREHSFLYANINSEIRSFVSFVYPVAVSIVTPDFRRGACGGKRVRLSAGAVRSGAGRVRFGAVRVRFFRQAGLDGRP